MNRHEGKTGKNLIFLIAVLLPVITAAVFLFNAKKNFDMKKKTEYEKQLQVQAEAEKKERIKKDAEDKIREHWRKTVQEANALIQEEDFATALAKMEALREEIKESAFTQKTEAYIQNIIKLREIAVKKLMNKLTDEVNLCLAEGNTRKAFMIYKNYSGKLAEETKKEREKLAAKISEYQNTQAKNN